MRHPADLCDTTNQPLQTAGDPDIPLLTTTSVPSGLDEAPIPNTQAVAGYFSHLSFLVFSGIVESAIPMNFRE